ncbi:hypothetical protein OS493_032997 [Desmophyllum pertusum]|uniref:Uncharacterized protein n=1 Tax=Desmophyllum pertusum TaxID=174260 RepID=A0A9W9ZWI3_9CNID|nr:hypothetical protein OS493_032997 [Desmophyllum pertusum]
MFVSVLFVTCQCRDLMEKMKKRRAAMEATIMSDAGSYRSDTEDTPQRTVTPAHADTSLRPVTGTEIETLSPGGDTMVESLQDLEEEGDMLQDLQTRRQQRKEEMSNTFGGSGGAWGEERSNVDTPSPAGPSRLGEPGPDFSK